MQLKVEQLFDNLLLAICATSNSSLTLFCSYRIYNLTFIFLQTVRLKIVFENNYHGMKLLLLLILCYIHTYICQIYVNFFHVQIL